MATRPSFKGARGKAIRIEFFRVANGKLAEPWRRRNGPDTSAKPIRCWG